MVLAWLSYYLWLQLTALAVLPLSVRVFRALPDRGYAFSKFLGLLLLTYGAWLLGMLGFLEHSRATLVVLLVVLAAVCWGLWGRHLWPDAPSRGVLLAFEALLLLALAGGSAIRVYNADISGTEKFMDYAFMNAFATGSHLPAQDPWLAGYGVPYYYFGFLLMATAAKLAGLAAPVGYNLALVLTLALTLTGAASLVYNAAALLRLGGWQSPVGGDSTPQSPAPTRFFPGAFVWGLLAAALVGLIGNLEAVLEVLAAQGVGGPEFWRLIGVKGLTASTEAQGWLPTRPGWWFTASRVIPNIQPDGITEFPYFSFLLGDLHPHYQALPYDLLVLALAFSLALVGRRAFGWPGLAVSGLALASIVVANTWDVPAFWLVFAAASLWAAWREGTLVTRDWRHWLRLVFPFALAVVLVLPYTVAYTSQRLGLGLVAERTPLISMLIVLGPFLAVALLFGLWGLASGTSRAGWAIASQRLGRNGSFGVGLAILAVLLLETVARESTLLLLTGLLALLAPLGPGLAKWGVGGLQLASSSSAPTARGASVSAALATWFLTCFGLLILLGTELIFISDAFGTRMNTVFKFQYDVWLLLGLASALSLAMVAYNGGRAGRALTIGLAIGMLVAGSVYPIAASYTKSDGFRGRPTLDGSRFLAERSPADFEAIQWLRSQAEERPVVLEAVGDEYQVRGDFGRVSTFSGLPAILGWAGHELQWRGNGAELGERERDVEALYRSGDELTIKRLLDRYQVSYVFVGGLERAKYGAGVDTRFAGLLQPVYQVGDVTVYRVSRQTGQSGGTR